MKNVLKRDDWVLTLNDLKNQRVQCLLQLGVLDDSIAGIERRLDKIPVDRDDVGGPEE